MSSSNTVPPPSIQISRTQIVQASGDPTALMAPQITFTVTAAFGDQKNHLQIVPGTTIAVGLQFFGTATTMAASGSYFLTDQDTQSLNSPEGQVTVTVATTNRNSRGNPAGSNEWRMTIEGGVPVHDSSDATTFIIPIYYTMTVSKAVVDHLVQEAIAANSG